MLGLEMRGSEGWPWPLLHGNGAAAAWLLHLFAQSVKIFKSEVGVGSMRLTASGLAWLILLWVSGGGTWLVWAFYRVAMVVLLA